MDEAMRKIAGDVPAILNEAAAHMEHLSTQNVALEKRANDYEQELRAMKLARAMEERGISTELSYEQKVAELLAGGGEKLAQLEGALEFAARGFSLGSVKNDVEVSSANSSADPLGDYISSQAAYT